MIKNTILIFLRYYSYFIFCIVFTSCKAQNYDEWSITKKANEICIKAGRIERNVAYAKSSGSNPALLFVGKNRIGEYKNEISVTLWKAIPDTEPQGIGFSDDAGVEQKETVKNQTDALKIEVSRKNNVQQVAWIDSLRISGTCLNDAFDSCIYSVNSPKEGQTRLTLRYGALKEKSWEGISAEINYQIYKGYPVIRKWVKFTNRGNHWIKIGNLVIDGLEMKAPYTKHTFLTPPARGIGSCMVAFSDSMSSTGVISVSEVPSKIRDISKNGASGYNPDFFEWVLGPGESFDSEPVILYAFDGKSVPTISATSTALDRCVEGPFKAFLKQKILMPFDTSKIVAPLFCSWTNYNEYINEKDMCEAAEIGSAIGFRCFQLDAGWSDAGTSGEWAITGREPNKLKFPDLESLSSLIHSKGMKMGLWYSVFRDKESFGKANNGTELLSLPLVKRGKNGLGISFACKGRDVYSDDIVYLSKKYNCNYFKQDLSNICYGDIAEGHENRTLKESYLRGLRGLFASQDKIHRSVSEVYLQLSHEIYWETPGPAADVAVLEHVDSYHISPNEYWGAGIRNKRVVPSWNLNPDSLSQKLIFGCLSARKLLYAHRGLPLERIEVFGAVTTNYKGSLTPEIQDRQICSWLMGSPLSFSGDLSSLTKENIERYRDRFAKLDRLQKKYGIYSFYQFSGVPGPTDTDWHWWGKLNPDGFGVVVVLRGSSGEETQKINIPWVQPDKKYRLKALFEDKEIGIFDGSQLQKGDLTLTLKRFGQEIIEISN